MKINALLVPRSISLVALGALYGLFGTPAALAADHENQCFNEVQGKIAWNDKGNMNWSPENVKQLCRGTVQPAEPGKCFLTLSTDHAKGEVNWGKGTEWEWQNMINLCSGTSNAAKTVECFNNGVKTGADWRDVILTCQRVL